MNATLDLQLLGHGTYLTAAGEPPVRVTLGFDEVVQQHFLKDGLNNQPADPNSSLLVA